MSTSYTLKIGASRSIKLVSLHVAADPYLHPTIASLGNNTYITMKDVPAGTDIADTAYWTLAFSGGMTFAGTYIPATTYGQHESVQLGTKIWIVTTGNTCTVADVPGVSTKWFLLSNASTLTYTEDSILYTDSTGQLQTLPVSPGTASYDGNNLAFGSGCNPALDTNVNVTAAFLGKSDGITRGSVFVSTDDVIFTTGWATSYCRIFARHVSAYSGYTPLKEDVPHTGTWAKVGYNFTQLAALTTTGELYVMGDNKYGALGMGLPSTHVQATLMKTPLTNVVGFTHGGGADQYGCLFVWFADGTAKTCGYNSYGQLGVGTTANQFTFTPVIGITGNIVNIYSSPSRYASTTFFTDATGDNTWACGMNKKGCLGVGHQSDISTPRACVGVSGKDAHSCPLQRINRYQNGVLLTRAGTIMGTGYGGTYSHGRGSNSDTYTYVASTMNGNVVYGDKLWGRDGYHGARWAPSTVAGEILLWGSGNCKSHGSGTNGYVTTVTAYSFGGTGRVIDMSIIHSDSSSCTYLLTETGEVWFSGNNDSYQNGIGMTGSTNSWRQVPTDTHTITEIQSHGIGRDAGLILLTSAGIIYHIGSNSLGESGDGTLNGHALITRSKMAG